MTTRDLDFWQNANGDKEKRVRAIAKQFEDLGKSIEDYWQPIRLAYWFDTHLSEDAPKDAYELAELIDREAELFSGDYESLAEAAEDLTINHYDLVNDEAIQNIVVDWAATWDYTFQYDFDSCEYILAEEPKDTDFVQLPKFLNSGVWIWRNN